MDTVNLLIKPASFCNIRCRYCFYADVAEHTDALRGLVMAPETAEAVVRETFAAAERLAVFGFQGGEPTLAGLDFFRRFLDLERKYAKPGVRVQHTIQTNGLLLDEEWAAFLQKNRFLVGLSMDGGKAMHDRFRADARGEGTWRRVRAALDLLEKHGVETNLLSVITGQTAKHPEQFYRELKATGCRFIQPIPCLDPLGSDGNEEYSLRPKQYGKFLATLFDLWYRDWAAGDYVSIRPFDDYVHLLCGGVPSSCTAAGRCGQYLVVESDGTVYPCDFYTVSEWSLGNIRDKGIEELLSGELAREFIRAGGEKPEECRTCPYYRACRGGCKRDYLPTLNHERNRFCEAYKSFFSYAWERLGQAAAAELRARRSLGGRGR